MWRLINVNANLHLSWCFELKLEWLTHVTLSISFSKLKQYKNPNFVYYGKTRLCPGKVMLLTTNMLIAPKKVQNAVPCWNQMTVLASEVTNLVPGNIWQHDFAVNVDGCLLRNNKSKQKNSHHVSITWTVCCFVNWKCFWMSLNLNTYEVALKKGPLLSSLTTVAFNNTL